MKQAVSLVFQVADWHHPSLDGVHDEFDVDVVDDDADDPPTRSATMHIPHKLVERLHVRLIIVRLPVHTVV